MKNNIYQHKQLQERQSTSFALISSAPAKSDVVLSTTNLSVACRREKSSQFKIRSSSSSPQGKPCDFQRT